MKGNVLSWELALQKGHDPRLYSFMPGDVPIGEFDAVLDFKIWAKNVIAISCYFTRVSGGQKFQLTVYYSYKGAYRLNGCDLDFYSCPEGVQYYIKVSLLNGKKIVFCSAYIKK